jgi:arylsulfatase A-like enzyme
MKTIFVATAGALAGSSVFLVAFIAINGVESVMWRETLFVLSCNTLFCGVCWWPLSKIRSGSNVRFSAIAGALLAIFGWFALPIALLKRKESSGDGQLLQRIGKLSYLLPLVIFFALPQMRVTPQMLERPALKLSESATNPSATTPNVLFVVVDTLRADVILDPEVPTPNLDALRERGTWAEYAVAPCNQTLPSHLVLLTGLDIEKVGMRGNLSRWPSTELLAASKCLPIAERFKLAGYNTAAVSTNTLLSVVDEEAGHQGFDDGFDTWHGISYATPFVDFLSTIECYTLMGQILPKRVVTFPFSRVLFPNDIKHFLPHFKEGQRTTDSTVEYLQQLQSDERPYFMMAQYFDPHSPYIAPAPVRGSIASDAKRPKAYSDAPEDEYFMRVDLRDDCDDEVKPDNFSEVSEHLHNLYKEEVVYFDQQLGRLLEQAEQGARETLIVFVSDHGESFGAHNSVEHGSTLYNDEILVPFIIAGPGVPESNKLTYAPDLIDASYTMLELSGIATANVDGQSVLDENYRVRPALSFKIDQVSMIDGDYKLHAHLVYPDDKQPYIFTPLALYDLSKDANEEHNLMDTLPDVVAEIEVSIAARMADDLFPHISERQLSDKQLDQLGALGYTD